MSGIALSFLAGGGGGAAYWIATLGDQSTIADQGYGIAVDSLGNSYVVGTRATTNNDILLAKYDASGIIQWQRSLSSSNADDGKGIAVDSSGNVYITGNTDTSSGQTALYVAKYDTSGALQWQRVLDATGFGQFGRGIAVDSSANIYVTGGTTSNSAGSYDMLIAKYNTSGTIQWQRVLGGTGADIGYGVAVDSSGNSYIANQSNTGGNYLYQLSKYNTSGTIQWQRSLSGVGAALPYAIAVDSSGNSYLTGFADTTGAGVYDVLTTKYDTSGTIQWQRFLGGVGYDEGAGITVDSSGNSYVIGYSTISANNNILIAKYDTSGNIQWQRTLNGTGNDQGKGITVDNLGSYYITGYTTTGNPSSFEVLIAKLPTDGSLTGTYGGFTYAASSFTGITSALTSATTTLTAATSTLSPASGTLTSATSTLTSVKITI